MSVNKSQHLLIVHENLGLRQKSFIRVFWKKIIQIRLSGKFFVSCFENSRKCYYFWRYSTFELTFFYKYALASVYRDPRWELYTWRKFDWEIFCFCIRILDVRKLLDSAFDFGSSRDSNTFFLCFCGLNCFHEGLNRKLKICTGIFHWKTITSVPWVGIMIVRKFQKMLTILVYLDLQTQISQ